MRTNRVCALAAVALLAYVAGCSSFTSGNAVSKYDKGGALVTTPAPTAGTYALYKTLTDTTPIASVPVEKGDELGFKSAKTGMITAVAGSWSQDFPEASYVWKLKK